VRRALEVPFDGAVVRVECQARGRVKVVAGAQVRVPRCRVTGAEQQQVGFRVVDVPVGVDAAFGGEK
jgi:hypothetical protein